MGIRKVGPAGSKEPVTRAHGRTPTVEIDPNTGEEYVTVRSKNGRLVYKNRSDGWRGYKSHLTKKQRRLIAWALRQRDRGCSQRAVWEKLVESGQWVSGPMQYPLTQGTVASWELTRRAEWAKGRDWPVV